MERIACRAACAAVAAMCLQGCATPSPYEQCQVKKSEGWVLSGGPDNQTELLGLNWNGKTANEHLSMPGKRQEVWFARGPDNLLACRYEDSRNVCESAPTTAEFRRNPEGWSVVTILQSICVTADKR